MELVQSSLWQAPQVARSLRQAALSLLGGATPLLYSEVQATTPSHAAPLSPMRDPLRRAPSHA
jgi:hypothetical protein